MATMVSFTAPRTAVVVDEERRPLGETEVRVRTLFSGISAGTELTAYRGSNPYLNKRWDDDGRLFVDGDSTMEYPVNGWGYEEVGEVVEVGASVTAVHEGDRVWGTWGHRSETVLQEQHAAARVLPAGADPRIGIFSQIGAIALNVILDADIHVGETVAVFGLGVPGQLAAQLARLNGGRVIAVDGIPERRDLAKRLGAHEVLDAGAGAVAERIRKLTDGRGADVCLEVTGNYRALHEAIRSVAYSSRVVAAGFMQGEGAGLRLGEEFHHNRVRIVASQISGTPVALGPRWGQPRLVRTFMDQVRRGAVDARSLVTHVVDAADVAKVFERLDRGDPEILQAVLRFPAAPDDR
jgi:2-desacetyl-2-hydroxyethyl bacteriochlorophyllide A dehydrogenase